MVVVGDALRTVVVARTLSDAALCLGDSRGKIRTDPSVERLLGEVRTRVSHDAAHCDIGRLEIDSGYCWLVGFLDRVGVRILVHGPLLEARGDSHGSSSISMNSSISLSSRSLSMLLVTLVASIWEPHTLNVHSLAALGFKLSRRLAEAHVQQCNKTLVPSQRRHVADQLRLPKQCCNRILIVRLR